jgi:hypothetical protein
MGIDRVDIGGAAKRGRPQIPAASTVVMDEAGYQVVEKNAREEVPVPDRVASAVEAGTQVAYPEDHPANNEEIELDAKGRLMPGKGQILTKPPEALGDVQRGFVSDQKTVLSEMKKADAVLNELEQQEVDQAGTAVPVAESSVAAAKPLPMIEVTFHLEIGAIVSYYNKVVQQGQWLILIVDNRGDRRDRFIPRPREGEAGPEAMTLVITGEDRTPNQVTAIPLGIQFAVDEYDFVVMMVEESEEE